MVKSPLPKDESERLAALRRYQILDTEEEQDFNDIVELASELCTAPISLITLIDEHRQWFKSKIGINIQETPRDIAFCGHAIHQNDIMVVNDLTQDERFFDNPFVTGEPFVNFYAGMPLVTTDGYKLGTLCVFDTKPKSLTKAQLAGMRVLGKHVVNLLNLRFNMLQLSAQLESKAGEISDIFERVSDAVLAVDKNWNITYLNNKAAEITQRIAKDVMGSNLWEKFPEAVGSDLPQWADQAMINQHHKYVEPFYFPPYKRWLEADLYPSSSGITIYIRDVSERKTTEQALRESEKFLKETQAIARLGTYKFDIVANKWTSSEVLDAIYGIDSNFERTFENWITIVDPAWQKIMVDYFSGEVIGKRIKFDKEYKIIRVVDGAERWVHGMGSLKLNDHNEPIAMVGTIQDITEAKFKEESERQSEERIRMIFKTLSEGVSLNEIILDDHGEMIDHKILEVNDAFYKVADYNKEIRVVGGLASQLYSLSPDAIKWFWGLIKGATETTNVEIFSGISNRHFAMAASPIENKRFVCSFRDITDRKRDEAALRASEEKYRGIFENAIEGIYQSTRDGHFMAANPALAEILGYSSPQELMNNVLRLRDIYVNEDDRNRWLALLEKQERVSDLELSLLKKSKEVIQVRAHIRAIKDNNGDISYFEGSIENITKRKEAEEKLRSSENKLRAFFRSTPDSSVLLGKNFEIQAFNDAANELYEGTYNKRLNEGDIFVDFIFPEVRPLIIDYLMNALAGETGTGEFLIPNNKTGRDVWWLAAFMPAYDEAGNIFGVVANSTNIDELKRSGLKLIKQNEELQKTNHELDRFVYSVSHDLRAPLASILGLINVAELENITVPIQKYFEMIRSSVNRLDGFIKDILDYSRNARTEVQFTKINFQDIIAGIQNNFKHIAGAERIKVKLTVNGNDSFYSDSVRVGILFNNLFSNAVRYQDFHKELSFIDIAITISPEKALIAFSDNGIGIKEIHLSKIFDMFYRASNYSSGSGLGLYITKETVIKLGGSINVQSQYGLSTSFEIIIPNAMTNSGK